MTSTAANLFTRPDTFFGICEGLGEDLGIHANLLRVALAGLFFWNPYVAIAAYAAAGLIVVASRLLAPNPKQAPASVAAPAAPIAVHAEAEPLPLAA